MTEEQQINLDKDVQDCINQIETTAISFNKKEKESVLARNESPCTVCGKKEFVMKYRDVNGKVEGSISGSFSLFGGSISGYIDGNIQTAPVLSCRNCENERKIEISNFTSGSDILERNLPQIYSNFPEWNKKASDWLCEKGLEVALLLDRKYYSHKIANYDNKPKYSDEMFGLLGLKRKYPLPKPIDNSSTVLYAIIGMIILIALIVFL